MLPPRSDSASDTATESEEDDIDGFIIVQRYDRATGETRHAQAAGWRIEGSEYLGRTVRRSILDATGRPLSYSDGVVRGWLDASRSDYVDSTGTPAALWRVYLTTGALAGEQEDLELYEVLESLLPLPTPAPAALPVHVLLGNAPSAFELDSTSAQRGGTKRPSGFRDAAHQGGEPKRRRYRYRRPPQPEVGSNDGRWSDAEHRHFIEGYNAMVAARVDEQFYDKWATVANAVGTRSVTQCRSHAQKYFKKQKLAERRCRPSPPEAATNEQQCFIEDHPIWTPWPTVESLAARLADRD